MLAQAIWMHEEMILPNFYRAPGYNAVLRPLGLDHCMIVMLVEDGKLIGRWPMWRSKEMPPWNREDKQFMMAAAPHITRGLRTSQCTPAHAVPTDSFVALHSPTCGAVLMDGHSRVLAIDRMAQTIFDELGSVDGESLSTFPANKINSRLASITRTMSEIFNARGEVSEDFSFSVPGVWAHRTGIALRLRRLVLDGDPTVRHLLVLVERGELENYGKRRLMLRWGLSPREYEILRSLARGRRGRELSTDTAIAQGTLKTHLGRLVEKTGVDDYSELRYLSAKLFSLSTTDA